MSSTSFAASPGTEVDPMWSMRTARSPRTSRSVAATCRNSWGHRSLYGITWTVLIGRFSSSHCSSGTTNGRAGISTRTRTRERTLREQALGLGDERCELALAPVESPLALAQHLLSLLDLLEPEVRFQLLERRPQVGIGRQVVGGNPAAIPACRLPVAGETRDLLLDLRNPGDEVTHRLDLARERALQALGVRVKALLPAEELDGQCLKPHAARADALLRKYSRHSSGSTSRSAARCRPSTSSLSRA